MNRLLSGSLAAMLVLAAAACSGGDKTGPDESALSSARLILVEGNQQAAMVGSAVATVPRVRVTTAGGDPLRDVAIAFTPSAGGIVAVERATTNEQGYATPGRWMLGTVPGSQTLRATLGSRWVDFTATALQGSASVLSVLDAADSSFEVGVPRLTGPGVRVTDAVGNAWRGIPVLFTLSAGGAATSLGSVVSDATGIARLPASALTIPALSSTGRYEITASIPAATLVLPIVVQAGSGCYNRTLAIGARVQATLTSDDCVDGGTARYDDYAITLSAQTDFTLAVGGSIPLTLRSYIVNTMYDSYTRAAGISTPAVRYVLPAGTYGFRPRATTDYGSYTVTTGRSVPRETACGDVVVLMPLVTFSDSITAASCTNAYRSGYRDAYYRVYTGGTALRVTVSAPASVPVLDFNFVRRKLDAGGGYSQFLSGENFAAGSTVSVELPGSGSGGEYYEVLVSARDDRAYPFTLTLSRPVL